MFDFSCERRLLEDKMGAANNGETRNSADSKRVKGKRGGDESASRVGAKCCSRHRSQGQGKVNRRILFKSVKR
jgi:hypothetical protein